MEEGAAEERPASSPPASKEVARLVSGPYGGPRTVLSAMIANSDSPRKNAEEIVLNQQMLRIAEDLEDGPYAHRRSAELWDRWTRVLTTWDAVSAESRDRRIKYLIREGIPNPLRPRMWPLLVDLDQRAQDLVVRYPILLQSMDCEYEDKIMKDLARTFPMHPLFAERGGVGQQKMFNVLKAYAVHDPTLGYCQGMAFIVGILLMKLPEDQAFATLSAIMVEPLYDMRGVYDKSVGKMPFFFFVVDQLITEYVPEVWEQFQTEGIEASMFATQWFMTLFSQKFPFSLILRIWDIFLAEGLKIIFRVAVALVQLAREELCQLDFVGILTYFRNEIVTKYGTAEAQSALMEVVGGIKIKPKKLKQLEKDFQEKRRLEQEAEDPVRRLEQALKTKDAELNGLQAEKAEAEQVAIDMRILMLQTEDVKTTMVAQLQDALAAQAEAETRADALQEKLRQAGLDDEEYSSAALELKRVAKAQMRAVTRSADKVAAAPRSLYPLSTPAVYRRRDGQVVTGQVLAGTSSTSGASGAPGVGSGLGTDAVRRTLQEHVSSISRLNADLTVEGSNGAAAEQIERLRIETEAVLAVIEAAMANTHASEGSAENNVDPARQPRTHLAQQTASVEVQPSTVARGHERAHVMQLHQGMMGATVAASMPVSGAGFSVAGDHTRSKSGGTTGTFWGGLTRLSNSGASGASVGGSGDLDRDAAISRLEEGQSALQKSTLELSEALAASEARNAEVRKELEDTKELLKNSEQVRSSLLEIVSSSTADSVRSSAATAVPRVGSDAGHVERAEEQRFRRADALRQMAETQALAHDARVTAAAGATELAVQAETKQKAAHCDIATQMAKLSMEI